LNGFGGVVDAARAAHGPLDDLRGALELGNARIDLGQYD
jgi:hypothetical protein